MFNKIGCLLLASTLLIGQGLTAPYAQAQSNRQVKPSKSMAPARLASDVIPQAYALTITPDLAHEDFEGRETIMIELKKSRSKNQSKIILNSLDLSVFEAQIAQISPKRGDYLRADISRDDQAQTVILDFKQALPSGTYELSLKYNGKLNKKMRGMYLSTFKDSEQKEHKMISTQMEPTDARRMFPCFDEPAMKATYQFTVEIDPALTAISNAGVEFEKIDNRTGKKIVTFKKTPKISSYLVALVIGPMVASQARVVDGHTIRIYTVPGKEKMTGFALDFAAKILPFYEKYFGQPYPLDKLDLIAIPDFSAGAMENIGAITFRETALLCTENASVRQKMSVANVVAHEMAHLWFGDLVTMQWWDDLWLNEAFATWMADKAVDWARPDWRVLDDFIVEKSMTLNADSISATRKVKSPVDSPEDALEMFDEITYSKGASLLFMLENYMGKEKFEKGIKEYMAAHKFGNATTDDLWRALSDKDLDVAKLMNTWILQAGCPVVSFDDKGKLAQQRMLFLPGDKAKDKSVWSIPLNIKTTSEIKPYLLNKTRATATTSNALILNGKGTGYFRTDFDSKNLKALANCKPSLFKATTANERVTIISDAKAMTVARKLPVSDFLEFLSLFKDEQDEYVLKLVIAALDDLNSYINKDDQQAFAIYACSLLRPALDRIGMQPKAKEDDVVGGLRAQLLRALSTYGQDRQAITYLAGLFPTYLDKPESLDGNLLMPIATSQAYNGDQEAYIMLRAAWLAAKDPESRNRNLMALTAFQSPEVIETVILLSKNPEIKPQDLTHYFGRLLAGKASKGLAFKYLQQEYDYFASVLPEDKLPDLVEACALFNTVEKYDELQKFVDKHPMKAGTRAIAKTFEFLRIRRAFFDNQYKGLASYLQKSQKAPES